ncbi:farnesol dehydrogenase-like [Venturia canescens]|uniref:farnesol dehydrogenase-like n=1 Tax=Venturia canescens TaxID=32260 RepID=UPI001C9D0DDE|nr:farnesol dehydrogenase-like [Venturia canescens]XP_043286523.1 farnesol dehydrogenase-like [Venturia canescens]
MDRWRGKSAVVTGAFSGIGAAVSSALLSNGINVTGLDIQKGGFAPVPDSTSRDSKFGKFFHISCDLSKERDILSAFERIAEERAGVDILVNNAGVIDYKRIIESDRETYEKLVNLNILGVASCTREAVRSMRSRNVEGHIFNINSVVGHEIPERAFSDSIEKNGFNLYPATKHATVAMTHSLRREIMAAKLPIRITSLSPGLVKTNIATAAGFPELFEEILALKPEDIADGLIYALGTRPEVQVTELTIRRTGEP